MFMRRQQSHQRPADGVDADKRVVGEECKGEKDLAALPSTGVGYRGQMHTPRQIGGLANRVDKGGQQPRQGNDPDHEQRAKDAEPR